MNGERLRIGELLIEAGVLNHVKLREALDLQRSDPQPLGRILVESGLVTEAQLIQALSRQLSIPWVSLWHVDVPQGLLDLISREDAERLRVLPIYVRTIRGEPPALFVAVDDPTNEDGLAFVRESAGMAVRPMIAGPTDLQNAIRSLYGDEDDESEEEAIGRPVAPPVPSRPSGPPPPPPPRRTPSTRPVAAPAPEADETGEPILLEEPLDEPPEAHPEDTAVDGALPAVAQAAAPDAAVAGASPDAPVAGDAPAPPPDATSPGASPESSPPADEDAPPADPDQARVRPRRRHALAFTFLDGTSIMLGATPPAAAPPGTAGDAADPTTVAGLAEALRRYAADPASAEPLGERGTVRILASILELLGRKHLVEDEEIRAMVDRIRRGD
jgi:type IV pilus assembly protein PilB